MKVQWSEKYVDGTLEYHSQQGDYQLIVVYLPDMVLGYVILDEGVEAQGQWRHSDYLFSILTAKNWCEEYVKEMNENAQ